MEESKIICPAIKKAKKNGRVPQNKKRLSGISSLTESSRNEKMAGNTEGSLSGNGNDNRGNRRGNFHLLVLFFLR